jgi:hypothetical protein
VSKTPLNDMIKWWAAVTQPPNWVRVPGWKHAPRWMHTVWESALLSSCRVLQRF